MSRNGMLLLAIVDGDMQAANVNMNLHLRSFQFGESRQPPPCFTCIRYMYKNVCVSNSFTPLLSTGASASSRPHMFVLPDLSLLGKS
jgi:hypothetical protein